LSASRPRPGACRRCGSCARPSVSSFTRANGEPPPEKARRRVNAICASVLVRAVLTPEGRAVEEPDARDTYALFESTVSRSAVELAYRDEDRLSVCGAPSCGMLFLRDHPRQV
jgi:predicted RNA-binding Zn ribbon-like protein